MNDDGHCEATVSSIRPRAGRPLLQRRFWTALGKLGCVVSTDSARLVQLGYRGGGISQNPCFCETNPFVMLAKRGISHCGRNGWHDDRKMTNGFVLPRKRHRSVCHGSTACGVSSDSAPTDSVSRIHQGEREITKGWRRDGGRCGTQEFVSDAQEYSARDARPTIWMEGNR